MNTELAAPLFHCTDSDRPGTTPPRDSVIICRTCLTTEGSCYLPLSTLVRTIAGNQLPLLDCWRYCLQQEQQVDDNGTDDTALPFYVCALCSNALLGTYEFLKRAREALAMFQHQQLEEEHDDAVTVGVLEWDVSEETQTPNITTGWIPSIISANVPLASETLGSLVGAEQAIRRRAEGGNVPLIERNEVLTNLAISTPISNTNDATEDVEIDIQTPNDVTNEQDYPKEDVTIERHKQTKSPPPVETLEYTTQTNSDKADELCDVNDYITAENDESDSITNDDDDCQQEILQKLKSCDLADKVEITCAQCLRVYHDNFRFEDHLFEHRSMQPYACEMCVQRLQTMKGIVQHYMKAHKCNATLDMVQPKGGKKEQPILVSYTAREMYMCAKCSYESEDNSQLHMHLVDVHGISDSSFIIKKLPFECPKCLRCFSSALKVRQHCDYEHSRVRYSSVAKDRKSAVCAKCGKRFEPSKLKAHESRCFNANRYQCNLCSGAFPNRSALMAHKRSEHPTTPTPPSATFKCHTCGNSYGSRLQLRYHIKRHEARNFQCSQCPRNFIRLHDLSKHELVHTGEMPHKCDICNAAFRYTHSLNAHKERLHMNKLFKCGVEDCGKEFKTRSQLNDHKYKHIGNPYKCEQCPKNFMRREHFRRHTKAVHNIAMSEEALTKMYQQHMGSYNKHDIRKMSEPH